MKCLRLILTLLFFLVTTVASGKQELFECNFRTIPASILDGIKSGFPGWRIKTREDLEPYQQKLWRENKPRDCPGFTSGRFLNKTKKSYAILLIPDTPEKNGYKVVVLTRPNSKSPFEPTVIEEDKDQVSSSIVIYRVPPGVYSDPENINRVRIRFDGIQVEEMEVGSILYYWRNNQFHHLTTSE